MRGMLGVYMISLEHVSKTFNENRPNEVRAVKDVTLHIHPSEIYGIIGYSGAGKSTLVRCINLLERPSSGTVTLDGVAMTALRSNELRHARKKIGMIFQQFNLLPKLSARENVELPLIYQGMSAHKRRKRSREVLERVGLLDRMDHKPTELSGGQQQRVAIARALAGNPSLLLADEPTGNLDSKTGAEVMNLFKELHAAGNTIVLITHDAKIAAQTPRAIHIHDGKVLEPATESEVVI